MSPRSRGFLIHFRFKKLGGEAGHSIKRYCTIWYGGIWYESKYSCMFQAYTLCTYSIIWWFLICSCSRNPWGAGISVSTLQHACILSIHACDWCHRLRGKHWADVTFFPLQVVSLLLAEVLLANVPSGRSGHWQKCLLAEIGRSGHWQKCLLPEIGRSAHWQKTSRSAVLCNPDQDSTLSIRNAGAPKNPCIKYTVHTSLFRNSLDTLIEPPMCRLDRLRNSLGARIESIFLFS